MATNTYVALDQRTLSSATSSVVFSSIPSTYTDLVLVVNGGASGNELGLQFNSDTGNNYGQTALAGNGNTASSTRNTNYNGVGLGGLSSRSALAVVSIQNYSNSTTFKTSIVRSEQTRSGLESVIALVNTWRNTNAITSITIRDLSGANNLTSGSTFSLYGIRAEGVLPAPKATGGAIYSDSTHYYHVFGSSGVFTPLQSLTCDYLVIAGGGGGTGGGGGAGGLRSTLTATGGGGSLPSPLSLSASAYTITVGAGGAKGFVDESGGSAGTNGGASSIAGSGITTVSTVGGGAGGQSGSGSTRQNGASGGSGGGAAASGGSTNTGGSPTSNEGFAGGGNGGFTSSPYGVGGGGGAGAASLTATSAAATAGGAGLTLSAWATATGTGVNNAYAGGGGGGAYFANATYVNFGGIGGGGNGGQIGAGGTGSNGVVFTGAGGGGGGNAGSGGNGGSGLVILRYLKA